ncbi:MAG: PPOX class F420-dependent oxidoreductase [Frankia sp.]
MPTMSHDEWRAFLSAGTRTAKLATVRADGRPHVAPVWFVLDGDDVVFNTGADTVKGRNLRRECRASVCVDDEAPPFAFVSVTGPVTLSEEPVELLRWATVIAGRYMGADRAEDFGRRNGVPGELVVRLHPEQVVAVDNLTG